MELIYRRCCGLHVHKKSITACVLLAQRSSYLRQTWPATALLALSSSGPSRSSYAFDRTPTPSLARRLGFFESGQIMCELERSTHMLARLRSFALTSLPERT